jgi:hypothetical protein
MRGCRAVLIALGLWGCAGGSPSSRDPMRYGFREDRDNVWVLGPWTAVKPSQDADEVIDQLCPAIMALPRARLRDYGQEYCGVIYALEGLYYASHASPLSRTAPVGPQKRKSCIVPTAVRDERGQPRPLADFHSHPWSPSGLSQDDRRRSLQVYSVRIQLDTSCRLMKLVPYVHEDRAGEVYLRKGRAWELVGYIKAENKEAGIVTAVEGE